MDAAKIIRLGAAAALVLVSAAAGLSGQTRTVDCIAAVVNDDLITRVDVDIAEALGLVDPGSAPGALDRRRAVLERLIDRKIVLKQVRERTGAETALVDDAWKALVARLGAETLAGLTGRFGLTEADLRSYLEEGVRYRRVIDDRFGRGLSLTLKEIETYYNETYAPVRKRAGAAVRPLVEVLDTIEAEIRRDKIEAQAAGWIEGLREQAEIEIRTGCLK